METGISLAGDTVDISSLPYQISEQDREVPNDICSTNLLDEVWVVPVDSVEQTGAEASSLIENIDVRPSLHQQPGALHVTLGQGVVQRGEGRVVGGSVDVRPGLW